MHSKWTSDLQSDNNDKIIYLSEYHEDFHHKYSKINICHMYVWKKMWIYMLPKHCTGYCKGPGWTRSRRLDTVNTVGTVNFNCDEREIFSNCDFSPCLWLFTPCWIITRPATVSNTFIQKLTTGFVNKICFNTSIVCTYEWFLKGRVHRFTSIIASFVTIIPMPYPALINLIFTI